MKLLQISNMLFFLYSESELANNFKPVELTNTVDQTPLNPFYVKFWITSVGQKALRTSESLILHG